MTWGAKMVLGASAVLMWFAATVFYSEFGYDPNPDGMFRALTAMFVVGPMAAVLFLRTIMSAYRKSALDSARSQLLLAAIGVPVAMIVLAQFLLS